MKEIKIEFEKYDGTIEEFIQNSIDGDRYLLQMVEIDGRKDVEIKFCDIYQTMNGNIIGIINGQFACDYTSFMKIIGICKLIF